ncbi:MAG: ribbon-helix-helix domain-containing protein [Thermosphaera sp.]
MSKKRRFGISISTELASLVDELARDHGCERSKIIENAINEYLHENLHSETKKHTCISVLISVTQKSVSSKIIDKHREVVKSLIYHPLGDSYLLIIIAEGDSEAISRLKRDLGRTSANLRLVPLESMVGYHEE